MLNSFIDLNAYINLCFETEHLFQQPGVTLKKLQIQARSTLNMVQRKTVSILLNQILVLG